MTQARLFTLPDSSTTPSITPPRTRPVNTSLLAYQAAPIPSPHQRQRTKPIIFGPYT